MIDWRAIAIVIIVQSHVHVMGLRDIRGKYCTIRLVRPSQVLAELDCMRGEGLKNIRQTVDSVNEQPESMSCPIKAQMQIDIVVDEVFGNVVQYAFQSGQSICRIVKSLSDWLNRII